MHMRKMTYTHKGYAIYRGKEDGELYFHRETSDTEEWVGPFHYKNSVFASIDGYIAGLEDAHNLCGVSRGRTQSLPKR